MTTHLNSLRHIAIIGNGTYQSSLPIKPSIIFTFNGQSPLSRSGIHIDIHMSTNARGEHKLKAKSNSNSTTPEFIENHLNELLTQHTIEVECLPSTGYALIHGLWDIACDVSISAIRFDPSLVRPTNLSMRKPLPQAFHNWLGERRTTFLRYLKNPCKSWLWPLLKPIDKDNMMSSVPTGGQMIHHAEVAAMLEAAMKSGALDSIRSITQTSIEPSQDLLSPSDSISHLEGMFYLNRARSDTPNWWLYDTEASVLIEQIAANLRTAQHSAFRQAVILQAKAV